MGIPTKEARARLGHHPLDEWPHLLQVRLRAMQGRLHLWARGAHALAHTANHPGRIAQDRARRGHQLAIALDHGRPGLRRSGFVADGQHAAHHTPPSVAHVPRGIAHGRTGALHCPREHAHAVLQQGAVGRIVHIRRYDRGVDAKSTAVRDPGTLGHLDHLSMQLLDDLRAESPRDFQNRLRVGDLARIDARKRAVHEIGADLMLQIVVTPVEQMLQDQHPDDHLRRCARTTATPTLRPSCFERLGDDLKHGLVLEQCVDLAQPVGPQFVPIGQQNFEQTPLALSALNHARSLV